MYILYMYIVIHEIVLCLLQDPLPPSLTPPPPPDPPSRSTKKGEIFIKLNILKWMNINWRGVWATSNFFIFVGVCIFFEYQKFRWSPILLLTPNGQIMYSLQTNRCRVFFEWKRICVCFCLFVYICIVFEKLIIRRDRSIGIH